MPYVREVTESELVGEAIPCTRLKKRVCMCAPAQCVRKCFIIVLRAGESFRRFTRTPRWTRARAVFLRMRWFNRRTLLLHSFMPAVSAGVRFDDQAGRARRHEPCPNAPCYCWADVSHVPDPVSVGREALKIPPQSGLLLLWFVSSVEPSRFAPRFGIRRELLGWAS